MKLNIKYMVSQRCKMIVKEELKNLDLHFIIVDLGEIEIMEDINEEQREKLRKGLLKSGLELMEDKKGILIENIKKLVLELIEVTDEMTHINYPEVISKKLNQDYTYLSNVFSEMKGITLQQFIINNKVERIKDLIIFGKLNLTEIAWKMNYSSVAHLSNQFKKVTGLTPSNFKLLKENNRISKEQNILN